MPSTAALQEVLNHVDHAALALSGEVNHHERDIALSELEQVHELLSALAYAATIADVQVVPQRRIVNRPLSVPPPSAPTEPVDAEPAVVFRAAFDVDARSVRTIRTFCRQTCEAWRLPAAAASTVADLASELASNAVLHACGPIHVSLARRDDHVQVTVSDGSGDPPRRLPYRAGVSERGIGLRLVDQLSSSWGWMPAPQGKDVWARVAVPAPPAA